MRKTEISLNLGQASPCGVAGRRRSGDGARGDRADDREGKQSLIRFDDQVALKQFSPPSGVLAHSASMDIVGQARKKSSFCYNAHMRLVIQRVKKAKVTVVETGKVAGEIGPGLFVLVGVKKGDTEKDAEALVEKLSKLRVMADKEGKMNLSVTDVKAEILVVSQFTLYADTSGGNRPSFINAALPDEARKIYEHFVAKLKETQVKIETGSFGDYMEIEAKLDGPVTILSDFSSRN